MPTRLDWPGSRGSDVFVLAQKERCYVHVRIILVSIYPLVDSPEVSYFYYSASHPMLYARWPKTLSKLVRVNL